MQTPATFFDSSLADHGTLRVVCVPIGQTGNIAFQRCLSSLRQSSRIPLQSLTSTSSSSSFSSSSSSDKPDPFQQRSWDIGSARFQFIEAGSMLPECPFLDLQPHRKTFGLIGICHCPSTPDIVEALQSMEERMEEAAQRKGTTVWRCFAFDISDHQLTELHSKRGKPSGVQHLVPIVPNRMLDNGHSLLTIQIQSALNNLCGDIFMSLENSVASALDGTLQPPPRLQTAYDAKTMEHLHQQN